MVFLKETGREGIYRLVPDTGDDLNDLLDALQEIEYNKYQLIIEWEWFRDEEKGKDLGFSKLKNDIIEYEEAFKESENMGYARGYGQGKYPDSLKAIDFEFKIYDLLDSSDLEFREEPI